MSNNHRPPTVDKRIKRTKHALKDALIRLMEEKDFRSITITDIIERADYNRGTFYTHYPHKEALLDDVVNEVIDGFIEAYREPYLDKSELNIEQLPDTGVKIFTYVEQHANLFSLLLRDEYIPRFQEQLSHAIKEVITAEFPPPPPPINAEIYINYTAYSFLGLIIYWVKSGYTYSAKYMSQQLLAISLGQTKSSATIKVNPKKPME